jgi:osmoprotectant transport system substrate-binding protein
VGRAVLRLAGLLAVVAVIAAGCGGGGGGSAGEVDLSDADFVVGSKDFTEQLILGYITLQALEATGSSVEDQVGLASTDAARRALIGGDIDMYWEYTGTIWINHLGNTKPIPTPKRQYDEAAKADMKENQLKLLDPAPFNNTYALAIRDEAVKDVGVESEFTSRDDGLPGMEEEYGFEFPKDNISLFDSGVVYQRTDKGDPCNFGEVFVTDGRISALGLTVIEHDKDFSRSTTPPSRSARKPTTSTTSSSTRSSAR